MTFLIVFVAILGFAAAGTVPPQALPVRLLNLYEPVQPEGRISKGQPAGTDQFPYQVGLSLRESASSKYWCGGSLIGSTWVLTAAHCTDGIASVTVYLGSIVRKSAKVSYTVDRSSIIQHAGFNPSTLLNDVALIRIPAVPFSSSIQTIRLPSIWAGYASYEDSYAISSGWGQTSNASSFASSLNYARLKVISNSACAHSYIFSAVTSDTICVDTPQGVSPCQGDSGGPLALEGQNLLIGVASFVAKGGCPTAYPAGFVRVTSFLSWIKEHSGISY